MQNFTSIITIVLCEPLNRNWIKKPKKKKNVEIKTKLKIKFQTFIGRYTLWDYRGYNVPYYLLRLLNKWTYTINLYHNLLENFLLCFCSSRCGICYSASILYNHYTMFFSVLWLCFFLILIVTSLTYEVFNKWKSLGKIQKQKIKRVQLQCVCSLCDLCIVLVIVKIKCNSMWNRRLLFAIKKFCFIFCIKLLGLKIK